VPAINGILAKRPSESNLEGRSGSSPVGPSIVRPNVKDFLRVKLTAANNSAVVAVERQSRVFPEVEMALHDGTPETKACQEASHWEAFKDVSEFDDPDSRICKIAKYIHDDEHINATYRCLS
jgi:hypothetical protein